MLLKTRTRVEAMIISCFDVMTKQEEEEVAGMA